jgi:mono/diheme cytochrome c family protein
MKKLTIISIFAAGVTLVACSDVRRSPGRVYMPDMAYSRAYETYSVTEEKKAELLKQGIHYTNVPVPGTVKRGQDFTFRLPKDAAGDSTYYKEARDIMNPIVSPDSSTMKEAERLYLINCGICHGTALNGNGPLWKDGAGPYPAAPKNLAGDPAMIAMPEGQMYYSVTYGKGAMGSYASQLNSTQRWMVIHYVKSKQKAPAGGTPGASNIGTDTAKATQPTAVKTATGSQGK